VPAARNGGYAEIWQQDATACANLPRQVGALRGDCDSRSVGTAEGRSYGCDGGSHAGLRPPAPRIVDRLPGLLIWRHTRSHNASEREGSLVAVTEKARSAATTGLVEARAIR